MDEMKARVNTSQQFPLTANMANHVEDHIREVLPVNSEKLLFSSTRHIWKSMCGFVPLVEAQCREGRESPVARHQVDKGLEHSTGEETLRE